NGEQLPLSLHESRLLIFLYGRIGRIQTYAEIGEFLYKDAADNGPERMVQAICFFVRRIRGVLYEKHVMLRLENDYKVGYSMIVGPPRVQRSYKRRVANYVAIHRRNET